MKATEMISLPTIAPVPRGKNFFEKAEANPCLDCVAPCCRMLLIPHPTPGTFMDLDYIRYMLGFPSVRMILNSDGSWQVQVEQSCGFLDQETNLCTVHDTPRKPKTCVFFNPHQCWYKRNFATETPADLIHLDLEAFEALLGHVRFDDDGNVIEIPTWTFTRDLVTNGKDLVTNGKATVESLA